MPRFSNVSPVIVYIPHLFFVYILHKSLGAKWSNIDKKRKYAKKRKKSKKAIDFFETLQYNKKACDERAH